MIHSGGGLSSLKWGGGGMAVSSPWPHLWRHLVVAPRYCSVGALPEGGGSDSKAGGGTRGVVTARGATWLPPHVP